MTKIMIDTSIVKTEGIAHQLIKKLIYSSFQKYKELKFIKQGAEREYFSKRDEQGRYGSHAKNPKDELIFKKTEDLELFIEKEDYFGPQKTFLKPDLTLLNKKTNDIIAVIEIINSSEPSLKKYKSYYEHPNLYFIEVYCRHFDIHKIDWMITEDSFNQTPYIPTKEFSKSSGSPTEAFKKTFLNGEDYKFFGYIKNYPDSPFIFNFDKNYKINFGRGTRPYFNHKNDYVNNFKKKSRAVKELIKMTKEQSFKMAVDFRELQYHEEVYLKFKISRIIRKFDNPFLLGTTVDSSDQKYKGANCSIIYKNVNKKFTIEDKRIGETFYFLCGSPYYDSTWDSYKFYSDIIVNENTFLEKLNVKKVFTELNYWRL